jgi:hypothetical protein
MKGKGHKVGLTSTDGIYIDERLTQKVDASGPRSAQKVLQNPRVDLAVFEVARGGILREGLGYGRNDVAVVLNVTGDHLGLGEIDTMEQLAAVKQVIVEAVPRDGYAVLNADDPLVAGMRRHCSGNVIFFSGGEGEQAGRALGAPRRQGRRPRAGPARRAHGHPRRPPNDADRPHPSLPGDLRWTRAHERPERAGRRGGRSRGGGDISTTSGTDSGRSQRPTSNRRAG